MSRRRHRAVRLAVPLSLVLVLAAALPASATAPTVAAARPGPAPTPPVTSTRSERPSTPWDREPTAPVDPPLPELAAPPATDRRQDATDHVLVRFAPSASPSQQRSALSRAGSSLEDALDGTGWVQVDVGDQDPQDVVAQLGADPQVADVQLDHVRHTTAVPNDSQLGYAPYVDLMRLPRAWDASTGAGEVVAVLDTGVDASHVELVGQVLPGKDFVGGDLDPEDDNGHGTLVAGTVAARANNGLGSAGAAYDAKILPVKVLDASGAGSDSTIADGISWAAANGADVINLSLGGTDPSPVLLSAIQNAVQAGVVVVAAAGNEGTDTPVYPAAYAPLVAGLLAVSATDSYGALAAMSSWGDWVTLAAPGIQIIGPVTHQGEAFGNGTSFAAPFVSGTAALVRSHSPGLTPAAVEQRLGSTAADAGPRGVDPYYGRGVLDAAAAVTAADAVPAATPVPLDRAPSDPGPSDDTRATARTLPTDGADGTISPEGDIDWYHVDATSPGWYVVDVQIEPNADWKQDLDGLVEVRNAGGDVVATGTADPTGLVRASVPVTAAGRFWVAVSNSNGSASAQQYTISAAAGAPDPFARSYQPAPPGTSGANSIAAGDLTGDGLGDAVVPPRFGSGLIVYPGRADGTLGTPTELPGPVGGGGGIATVDVDRDGDLDVVACTAGGFTVFTQAAGALTAGTEISLPDCTFVIAADMDGDGDSDLILATSQWARLATNDGAGAFTLTTVPIHAPQSAGDVTGDGRPDLVSATQLSAQNADGTFAAVVDLPGITNSYQPGAVIADVTGDGRPDIVRTSNSHPGFVQVDSLRPDQTFAPSHTYPTGDDPSSPVVGDFDGDGKADVAVIDGLSLVATGYGVTLLRQQGDGTLGAPSSMPAVGSNWTPPTGGLATTDIDHDGRADLVKAAGGVTALRQLALNQVPTSRGWSKDVTPAPNSSGVSVRPTITIALERALKAGSASSQTVRLIDGSTGLPVAAAVSYSAGTRTISLTPSADLTQGNHYEVVASGLTDSANAVQSGAVRTHFTVAASGSRFTPVDPTRIFDSRSYGEPIEPGEELQLDLSALAAIGGTAVVLNVTSTENPRVGNVRVYPTPDGDGPPPTVSNLNIVPGVDQANLVTVALGADGSISLLPTGTSTHLIVDVAGYYSDGGASAFVPVAPVRVLDLRDGTGGVPAGLLAPGTSVDLQVTGRAGVPADAVAVVLNVTGTGTRGLTYARAYPTPGAQESQAGPGASSLNLRPGRDQPNLVTVKVGDGGRVRFDAPYAATYLLADIAGYYSATGDNGYVPLSPQRIADSRIPSGLAGMLRTGQTQDLQVTGTAGVPADATAAILNVTASQPAAVTHVRVFPTTVPASLPLVSSLNLVPGRDEANLTIARIGSGGKVSFYSHSANTPLIVDVSGYFHR